MKTIIIAILLPVLLLCSNNDVNDPLSADIVGSIWKISEANVNTVTISSNPTKLFDTTYLDTHKIAELGPEFGYFNFLSFLTNDTAIIYSNIIQDSIREAYIISDTNITIGIRDTSADTIRFYLEMEIRPNNRLYLDFPCLTASYYSSSSSMGIGMSFKYLQDRNIYISSIDTTFHSNTMDSLVYSTFSYNYLRQ